MAKEVADDLGRGEGSPQDDLTDTLQTDSPSVVGQAKDASDAVSAEAARVAALEEQVADLERQRGAAYSERDKAQLAAQQVQQEAILKLAADAVSRSAAPSESDADLLARYNAMAEDLNEADGKKILDTINSFSTDASARAKKETLAEIKAMLVERDERETATQEELARIKETVRDNDSGYLAVKDQVAEAAEKLGLDINKDRALLMEVVNAYGKKLPPRAGLPGTSSSTRVVSEVEPEKLSDETKAVLEANPHMGKLSAKDLAVLETRSA